MLATIQRAHDALCGQAIQAMLVGGIAVNQHGISRLTFDIDFAVADRDEARLVECMLGAGFQILHHTNNFIRFQPAAPETAVVDFLFLTSETFHLMWKQGQTVRLADRDMRVATPEHLIRMKLHALRYGRAERLGKDISDILQLMRKCGWTPDSPTFSDACARHGNRAIMEMVKARWTMP